MSPTQPTCIICQSTHIDETVEHIIPQSLGNVHYILPKGVICLSCNQRFSRYENRVVSSAPFIKERIHRGYKRPEEIPPDLNDRDALFVLLKITYESLYRSRKSLFNQLNHELILKTLFHGEKYVYSLIVDKSIRSSKPIPRFIDRWQLRSIGVSLRYKINYEKNTLTVEWRYGQLAFITYLDMRY